MTDLILIGGGGHCKSCIDVIERGGSYRIAGILDTVEHMGKDILGYRITGTDADIAQFAATHAFLITVGQLRSAALRMRLYKQVKAGGGRLATIISPSANVSRHSTVGEGSIVMHGASVNAGATIGVSCIVNTGANIEHDCRIGDHVHISTHAVLNGNCAAGSGSFIGSNAVLVNGVAVGEGITIGAGAVVHRSITAPGTYAGNPCRQLT